MQQKVVYFLIFFMLTPLPASGKNAMDYYSLGLSSTQTTTKIKYFSKALELDPMLADAYEKRGTLYFFQEKFDHVIQDFQAYIRLTPQKAEAFRMLGMGYLKRGFYERAIDKFNRAIEIKPDLESAYAYRAEAYRIKGMIEKAMSDSNKAIQLGDNWHSTAKAYKTLSKIYGKLGRNDLSEVNFSNYIALDPNTENYPPLHVPLIFNYPSDSNSLKAVGRMGLIGIILLAIVAIFKLKLPAPRKKD